MKKNNILYELKQPSSCIVDGPTITVLAKRNYHLQFTYEDDETEKVLQTKFIFEGVVSYKCTYLWACTGDMMKLSYDKLVEIKTSDWLSEVQLLAGRHANRDVNLHHLMICFDDGPCFEFICEKFTNEIIGDRPRFSM